MSNRTFSGYLYSLVGILVFWYAFGSYCTNLLLNLLPAELHSPDAFSFSRYAIIHSWFLFLGAGTLITARYMLYFPLNAFVTDADRIRWKRLAFTAAGWMALMGLFSLIAWLLLPSSRTVLPQRDYSRFLVFLPLACLAVIIQAGSEELFFRVFLGRFLTQLLSGISGHKALNMSITATVSGLLFLSAHLNNPEILTRPDAWAMYLYYFLFGFLLMYISLREGGYEAAFGIHIGNNLFTSLILNYEGSVMPTPALFVSRDVSPLMATVTLLAGFCIILLSRPPRAVAKKLH